MKKFSKNANEKEIQQAIIDWIQLLADEKFQEASEFLRHPNQEIFWTGEQLCKTISDYAKNSWRVTSVNEMKNIPDNVHGMIPFNDGSGYAVSFNLPINKQWSDLVAEFDFKVHEDYLVMSLINLHIL